MENNPNATNALPPSDTKTVSPIIQPGDRQELQTATAGGFTMKILGELPAGGLLQAFDALGKPITGVAPIEPGSLICVLPPSTAAALKATLLASQVPILKPGG